MVLETEAETILSWVNNLKANGKREDNVKLILHHFQVSEIQQQRLHRLKRETQFGAKSILLFKAHCHLRKFSGA